jgi:hypothetical protein
MIGANTLITGRRLIRKMPEAKIVSEFVAFTETNGCDKKASAKPAIDF